MEASSNHRIGLFLLRMSLGSIFLLHGLTNILGGQSFIREMLGMVGWSPPSALVWLIALLELFGGLALVLGIFTRWAALLLSGEMVVAVVLFHLRQGFFIIAVPNAPLAFGFEYHVALVGGLLCLVLGGPGVLAVENRIGKAAQGAEIGSL